MRPVNSSHSTISLCSTGAMVTEAGGGPVCFCSAPPGWQAESSTDAITDTDGSKKERKEFLMIIKFSTFTPLRFVDERMSWFRKDRTLPDLSQSVADDFSM